MEQGRYFKHIIPLHLKGVVYVSDTDIIRISFIYPSHITVGTLIYICIEVNILN